MMSRNLAILAGLALLVAVFAGILTIGGPGTARLDRQDQERLENLTTLENHVLCYARSHNGDLPDDLAGITGCIAAPPLTDPFTGVAYRYTINADDSFSICATFSNLSRAGSWAPDNAYSNFDRETGCVISRYKR